MCACQKVNHSQALLTETVETGDKNRDLSHRYALFCEESLGEIDAKDVELSFQNGSVHENVDYFGKIEYFDGEATNWLGVLNFHCMKMIKMTRHVHHVFGLWLLCNFS